MRPACARACTTHVRVAAANRRKSGGRTRPLLRFPPYTRRETRRAVTSERRCRRRTCRRAMRECRECRRDAGPSTSPCVRAPRRRADTNWGWATWAASVDSELIAGRFYAQARQFDNPSGRHSSRNCARLSHWRHSASSTLPLREPMRGPSPQPSPRKRGEGAGCGHRRRYVPPLPLAGEGWGEGKDSRRSAGRAYFPAFNRATSMSTNRHGCDRKLSFL